MAKKNKSEKASKKVRADKAAHKSSESSASDMSATSDKTVEKDIRSMAADAAAELDSFTSAEIFEIDEATREMASAAKASEDIDLEDDADVGAVIDATEIGAVLDTADIGALLDATDDEAIDAAIAVADKRNAKKRKASDDSEAWGEEAEDDFEELKAEDMQSEDLEEEIEAAVQLDDASHAEVGELAQFESAEVEDIEEVTEEELQSALESLLFATEKPQSIAMLKSAFQGTRVRSVHIRAALERLQLEYANPQRGFTLEEVAGGYQLRTKATNQKFLYRTVKARPFRLSGPALEVLSIVAYKQPCTKSMVDEIRGVESGHLMRGLLDRGLLAFGEKSELPGRPMFYETTRKFLEIFSLRNLQELPTLNEIDQLIPEGIGEPVEEKKTLSELTGELSTEVGTQSYSVGEEELLDISSELKAIDTTSEFFEQEKKRQREKRDSDRAQDIRERMAVGEEVEVKDKRWLTRYEIAQAQIAAGEAVAEAADSPVAPTAEGDVAVVSPIEDENAAPIEAAVDESVAAAVAVNSPGSESEAQS